MVKRASGVIETRGPLEPSLPAAVQPDRAEASAAPTVAVTPERAEPVTPTRSPALFEDVAEQQSFAEMYEASAKHEGTGSKRGARVGDKITGKIFQLGADTAFVSLGGGKSEAMIELRELKDEEGILRYGVGDTVEAYVTEAGAGGIHLTKSLGKGTATMAMLSEARMNGMPVEGLVLSVNKGGFEIAVGDLRAFCPISQMDLRFVDKPELFIGERFNFRVTELRERNVVLSRRALLEEEQKVLAAQTRKTLTQGAVVKGRILNVREFGAFVDLGGVEGMIPVSELSYARVGHPNEVVKTGDEVEVEILRIEAANMASPDKGKHKERITLSMRSRLEDPFEALAGELKEGDKVKGTVVRLQPFGAFVELKPGVDGLIHISAMSDRRIAHPRDVLKVGQEVSVIVERVDLTEKRVGLRIWDEENQKAVGEATPVEKTSGTEGRPARAEPAARAKAGQVVTGKVSRIEPYGIFIEFAGGRGLVPGAETGTERGTDLKRHFQLGQELKASILDIDATGKIRMSLTAAAQAEERAEVEAWTRSQPKGTGAKGFGTFADLLKNMKVP